MLGARAVRLYPIYHPAAALYTPRMLETLREDFARLPELLALGAPEQPPPQALPVTPEARPELAPRRPPRGGSPAGRRRSPRLARPTSSACSRRASRPASRTFQTPSSVTNFALQRRGFLQDPSNEIGVQALKSASRDCR